MSERKPPIPVEDEATLLASIGSKVTLHSQYESQVLKEATLSHAPNLTGIGFPDLASLAPSATSVKSTSKQPKRGKYQQPSNAADIPHMVTTLSKLQAKLDAIPRDDLQAHEEDRSTQILRMQYQILLTYLASHTNLSKDDLRIDIASERSVEDIRKQAYQSSTSNSSSKGVSSYKSSLDPFSKSNFGSQALRDRQSVRAKSHSKRQAATRTEGHEHQTTQRRRGRLQSLKRQLVEDANQTWVDPEVLYQKRKERLKKKLSRKGICIESIGGDVMEQKKENTDMEDKSVRKRSMARKRKRVSSSMNVRPPSPTVAVAAASTFRADIALEGDKPPMIICPDCNETLLVKEWSNADECLSEHLQSCQASSGRRRSLRSSRSRSAKQKINYCEGPNGEEKKEDDHYDNSMRKSNVDDDVWHIETSEDEELVVIDNEDRLSQDENAYAYEQKMDDFEEFDYEDRVDDWIENGINEMPIMKEMDQEEVKPGASYFEGGLHIPAWVNDRLFGYQRLGLEWMWELHRQGAGGIVGDEMGLGKTVQLCSFLGCMAANRKLRSVLIIAPATMLSHWLQELGKWSPGLRRVLIHKSGDDDNRRDISWQLLRKLEKWLKQARKDRINECIDEKDFKDSEPHSFCGTGYCIVTTYENIRRYPDVYCDHSWSYIVMDEGQKIRNPDAEITLTCKRLRTPNRLLLSGTPIQNDLKELWSLFDFVFPGRLGTLPIFLKEFADPIRRGGYSNASPMQVQLAYRCALTLRDMINPFLLRRQKKDIKEVERMPSKTEQVLFVKLSSHQRRMYESYLKSDEVRNIIRGSAQCFGPIVMLRKICNHPDLISDSLNAPSPFHKNGKYTENDIDNYTSSDDDSIGLGIDESTLIERSGKLEVLAKILPLWKKQGHRVLIFSQWKKMLDIIQRFVIMNEWKFGRMDGNTNVASRQKMVDTFNNDDSYFAMLMTTKTGGVGLNLTGADRIILYDPDWNPQTDAQARERAWRFGQKNAVTVYRLITAGTIEEKIYQRQIFKTAITNQVLRDPRQRRMFSHKDLRDLFTLKPDVDSASKGGDGVTETGKITKGRGVVDLDVVQSNEKTKDNKDTIEEVLKSKGLAGIFDHDVIDKPSRNKTQTEKEMETQAVKAARRAKKSLAQSSYDDITFTPIPTGSQSADNLRFGAVSNSGSGALLPRFSKPVQPISETEFGGAKSAGLMLSGSMPVGSTSLISQLKQRRNEISSCCVEPRSISSDGDVIQRIEKFLKRFHDKVGEGPGTSVLLDEFRDVQDKKGADFKKLLKSIARVSDGKWYLKR